MGLTDTTQDATSTGRNKDGGVAIADVLSPTVEASTPVEHVNGTTTNLENGVAADLGSIRVAAAPAPSDVIASWEELIEKGPDGKRHVGFELKKDAEVSPSGQQITVIEVSSAMQLPMIMQLLEEDKKQGLVKIKFPPPASDLSHPCFEKSEDPDEVLKQRALVRLEQKQIADFLRANHDKPVEAVKAELTALLENAVTFKFIQATRKLSGSISAANWVDACLKDSARGESVDKESAAAKKVLSVAQIIRAEPKAKINGIDYILCLKNKLAETAMQDLHGSQQIGTIIEVTQPDGNAGKPSKVINDLHSALKDQLSAIESAFEAKEKKFDAKLVKIWFDASLSAEIESRKTKAGYDGDLSDKKDASGSGRVAVSLDVLLIICKEKSTAVQLADKPVSENLDGMHRSLIGAIANASLTDDPEIDADEGVIAAQVALDVMKASLDQAQVKRNDAAKQLAGLRADLDAANEAAAVVVSLEEEQQNLKLRIEEARAAADRTLSENLSNVATRLASAKEEVLQNKDYIALNDPESSIDGLSAQIRAEEERIEALKGKKRTLELQEGTDFEALKKGLRQRLFDLIEIPEDTAATAVEAAKNAAVDAKIEAALKAEIESLVNDINNPTKKRDLEGLREVARERKSEFDRRLEELRVSAEREMDEAKAAARTRESELATELRTATLTLTEKRELAATVEGIQERLDELTTREKRDVQAKVDEAQELEQAKQQLKAERSRAMGLKIQKQAGSGITTPQKYVDIKLDDITFEFAPAASA